MLNGKTGIQYEHIRSYCYSTVMEAEVVVARNAGA